MPIQVGGAILRAPCPIPSYRVEGADSVMQSSGFRALSLAIFEALASCLPQFLKLFNRARSETGIVVIHINISRDAPPCRALANIDPTH
jgi:hypothetical protein